MKRGMAVLVCGLLIAGCSGRYYAPKAAQLQSTTIVNADSTIVWQRVYSFLASQSYAIQNARKDEGLLVAAGSAANFQGLDCGSTKGRARITPQDYQLSVMVLPVEAGKSRVSVKVEGGALAQRFRKFVFIPMGRSSQEVSCVSNGSMERVILAAAQLNT